MFNAQDPRVRRPDEHEALLIRFRDEAGFQTFRDSLLFAAAVGVFYGRRMEFSKAGDTIRFEVMTKNPYAEPLINMIAVDAFPEEPEILSNARLEERLRIFEEVANGGLSYIQEQLNSAPLTLEDLVLELVNRVVWGRPEESGVSIKDLISGFAN